jgi:hypothetical protein
MDTLQKVRSHHNWKETEFLLGYCLIYAQPYMSSTSIFEAYVNIYVFT